MKTLRDWLFQEHQAAETDLDEIRRQVVAQRFGAAPVQGLAAKPQSPAALARLLWRELIWPCRHAWTGLAAVWLLILALDHASADSPTAIGARTEALSPAMVTLLKEQRQLAADLDEPAAPPGTEAPQPRLRPRSELERDHHEAV